MLENFRIAKFLMQERQGIMIMKFYGRETERKKLNVMKRKFEDTEEPT